MKNLRVRNVQSFVILLVILGLGAYLRLWRISGYMTFLGDEGRDVLVVKRMIVDHDWTLLGPTASVGGFFLGPIYYYFMLPFLWVFRLNPTGPAVMVALFGVATIFLVYRVGRDFFNEKTGLAAALLYALSPVVIAYSRSSWNPNLVPFFSLLMIYSLWKSRELGKYRFWPLGKRKSTSGVEIGRVWLFMAGLTIGIGLQLHYLFLFLVPAAAFFVFLNTIIGKKTRKFPWRWRDLLFPILRLLKNYCVIFLGFIAGFSPFLAFEIRHGFPNVQTIIRYILFDKETSFTDGRAFYILNDAIFRLYGRLVFRFPEPEQVKTQVVQMNSVFYWWQLVIVLTIILTLALLLYNLAAKKRREHLLILIWLFFGIGLFAFYQREVYDYYFGVVFPLPFLLTGWLLSFFWEKKWLKPLAIIVLSWLIILNWQGRPFKYSPNNQMRQVKKAAEFVLEKAEGEPFNFALITGQNSDHGYRYFMELSGNSPVAIENFENDPERKTVTEQLLVICEVSDCKPLGHPLWEIAGFGQAEIAGEWQVGVLKIVKLEHYEKKS